MDVEKVKAEKQSVKYRRYRQEVFKRDGYQCECGNKDWLRLYHFDESLMMLYEPSNAITVCRGCHLKKYAHTRHSTGRGQSSFLVIKVKVLAEVSGKCEETVRRHIRDGKIDPWDLLSIKRWIDKIRKEDINADE